MESDPQKVASAILIQLEHAWNAGDGAAFGRPFASDADFVDIRSDHHRGREAIVAGHQGIFDSIYSGSRVSYTLVQARHLSDAILLVHSRAELLVPAGPMAGQHRSTQSLVLARGANGWEVASFHNTLAPPPRN